MVAGILLVDKPRGKTSFSLVSQIRRLTKVKKVGHAGTLDPFATGVMVLLIDKTYTRLSDRLMDTDKQYHAHIRLGISTDTYDPEGQVTKTSSYTPSQEEVERAVAQFQGSITQIPPMFSAKKVAGKKLYQLARKGITIERKPISVTASTSLLSYEYPYLDLSITCSKGTYIRSIAEDLGNLLQCGGHLESLIRTRSGSFLLSQCLDGTLLSQAEFDLRPYIKTSI